MRRILQASISVLCLAWGLSAHAQEAAEAQTIERPAAAPFELVRTLQLLQDQIALGSTTAHVAQRALLSHVDESMVQFDDTVWQERKNVRAAVLYVLSGGKPDILKRLLAMGIIDKQDEPLVQGAVEYVEGREEAAKQLLLTIDINALPPSLGGQLALVQSALVVGTDPARSAQLLDRVRLILPGTLVEEAALRREVLVVGQMGDTKKYEHLVRQYLHRFRASVYSGNFRQRLAATLTRLDFGRDPDRFAQLVAMLKELNPEGRRELYLQVARSAIDRGQTQAAILAADKAGELSATDRISAARARLYKAAAIIVTITGFESGLEDLKKINRADLPTQDLPLLDAALALAQQIRSDPSASPMADATPSGANALDPAKIEKSLPSMTRAKDAMTKIDELIKRKPGEQTR